MQAIQNKNEFFVLNGVKIYKEAIINLSDLTIEKAIELAQNCEKQNIKVYTKNQRKVIIFFARLSKEIDGFTLKIAKIVIDKLIWLLFVNLDKVNEKIEIRQGKNFEKKFSDDEIYTMFLQYPTKDDERLVSIRSYYRFLTKRQANYIRNLVIERNKTTKKSQ